MVATYRLASDCKYTSVHRMLMATQPSMLPARMATIRCVLGPLLGMWEGGRKRMVSGYWERNSLVPRPGYEARREKVQKEDEQSKIQPLRVCKRVGVVWELYQSHFVVPMSRYKGKWEEREMVSDYLRKKSAKGKLLYLLSAGRGIDMTI